MKTQLIVTVTHPDKYPATQFINIAIKSMLQDINSDCDEGWSVTYSDVPAINVWATNEGGNYTCVDCMDEVAPWDTLGNREHGEPRCAGCYDRYKYGA
jgi:hypothetical protein